MDTLEEQMKIFKQILFEKEMHFFKDYLGAMEEFLGTEAQHLAQSLETLDLGYEPMHVERDGERDEDDYEVEYEPSPREVQEQLRDRLNDVDDFANLLRSSFFVSLYSFLDSRLMNECRSRSGGADIRRRLSKMDGSDLDKFQQYFEKVLKIYFPGDESQWQEIKNYRLLRNCIVHNRGTLSGFRDACLLTDYISRKPDLRISGDEISLDAAFCSEAFETVKGFFCLLISSGSSDDQRSSITRKR